MLGALHILFQAHKLIYSDKKQICSGSEMGE